MSTASILTDIVANMSTTEQGDWIFILTVCAMLTGALLWSFVPPYWFATVRSALRQHRNERRNLYEARRRQQLSAVVIAGQFEKGKR